MPKRGGRSKVSRENGGITSASASGGSGCDDPRVEAARRRLRESAGQADTIEAIREIVTNLLGCEEIGLFTVEQENSGLFWSFGIDPKRHGTLNTFEESVVRRVLQGELQVQQIDLKAHANRASAPLRAFIPIHLNGRIVAVLVMLRLLPQKAGFDEADIRLVKLLSEESGRALFGRSANATAG
jgi:hypothetical protein